MNVRLSNAPIVKADLQKYFKTVLQKVIVLPPLEIEITDEELSIAQDFINEVCNKVNEPIPPRIRLDTVVSPTHGWKVLEVEADSPMGFGFLLVGLEMYGYNQELERCIAAIRSGSEGKKIIYVREKSASLGQFEFQCLKRYVGNAEEFILEEGKWIDYLSHDDILWFRVCEKMYFDGISLATEWPENSINPLSSWRIALKSNLEKLNSPLYIPAVTKQLDSEAVVSKNIVAKKAYSYGGKDVFFEGENPKEVSEYLLQQEIDFPIMEIDGKAKKWGVDIYFFNNQPLVFSRMAGVNEKKLNVLQGGGYAPGVLSIINNN